MSAASWRRGWTALVLTTLSRIVLGAIAVLLAASVLPALAGWQSSVVMSGSMEPTFSPGDVAVVRPVAVAALHPGEVLLVDDPDVPGRLRLHRLAAVEAGGLQLRGDANPADDHTLVQPAAVHGVVSYGLPLVGMPAVWIAGHRVWPLLGTAAGLAALVALAFAHRRPDDDPPTGTSVEPAGRGRTRVRPALRVLRRGALLSGAVLVTVALPGAAAVFSDTSASPSITIPVNPFWVCPDTGASAGATNYYRLQEGWGATTATNTGTAGTAADGTYSSGGVSYAQSGPTCGTNNTRAVTFDGSTGYLWTTQQVVNPQTFSVQLWFNTTTTSGGKLIGFGNGTSGSSSSQFDRHIYLTNSGQVVFGVYNSGYYTVTSPYSYNNGAWHLATATFSASTGLRLYLDGSLVGSSTATTLAENTTGYWRIGYDNLGSWPSAPTSSYYAGSLAQVSIYSTVLSSTQVAQAWQVAQ